MEPLTNLFGLENNLNAAKANSVFELYRQLVEVTLVREKCFVDLAMSLVESGTAEVGEDLRGLDLECSHA